MELPLAKGRRRDSKKAFFNGKEGRDDFRRTPSLTVRKVSVPCKGNRKVVKTIEGRFSKILSCP